VVPASVNKGSALAEFMREPPFRDRLPLYLGDDLTDEPAFHWVNLAGGTSVVVNPRRPSAASAALPDVTAVRAWLSGLLET
jgi:trehalose 6-phosphate phosphatase